MQTPKFTLNTRAFSLALEITRLLGRYEGLMGPKPQPKLRRANRIRSIQGSLSIEGNSLSLEQISDLIDGKRVVGPQKDILEVQNANFTYLKASELDPYSIKSLLKAHGMMMKGLLADAGSFRRGNIGIWKKGKVTHVAPKAQYAQGLIKNLLYYTKKCEVSPLISSSVFHYEFEVIHPFSDGNGRMGRLWQHILLIRFHPLFEFVPLESVIHSRQKQYYDALETADNNQDSGPFVEFMLTAILEGTQEFLGSLRPEKVTALDRLVSAQENFKKNYFSRKEYISYFVKLSSATASRDLKEGAQGKLLEKQGDKALTRYRFKKS